MGRLTPPSGQEMVRFLQRMGFELVRIRSSHHFMRRDACHTSVPVHGNRPLKIGTFRSILRDINMSPAEFSERFRS